jgi:hypothetical protein
MAERVANGEGVGVNTPLDFNAHVGDAVSAMAPWYGDNVDELRQSEVDWLDGVLSDAREAAENAAIDAAVAILTKRLRELAARGASVPAHLLEKGPAELRADLALLEAASTR